MFQVQYHSPFSTQKIQLAVTHLGLIGTATLKQEAQSL
jgi:hypothetical protein